MGDVNYNKFDDLVHPCIWCVKLYCPKHQHGDCDQCHRSICPNRKEYKPITCEECQNDICRNCIRKCISCGKNICENDTRMCWDKMIMCKSCFVTDPCEICGNDCCSVCVMKCAYCNILFCLENCGTGRILEPCNACATTCTCGEITSATEPTFKFGSYKVTPCNSCNKLINKMMIYNHCFKLARPMQHVPGDVWSLIFQIMQHKKF